MDELAERRVGIVREKVRLQKERRIKPCNIKKMRRKDSGLVSVTEKNYSRWQSQKVEKRTSILHDLPTSVLTMRDPRFHNHSASEGEQICGHSSIILSIQPAPPDNTHAVGETNSVTRRNCEKVTKIQKMFKSLLKGVADVSGFPTSRFQAREHKVRKPASDPKERLVYIIHSL